jgi:hypothetical protein
MFWLKTVVLYLLVALVASLLSIVITFLIVLSFAKAGDDSPVYGLVWIFLCAPVAGLLIPTCLAITAELIQRKSSSAHTFRWSKALCRVLMALPMMCGPLYGFYVLFFGANGRPRYWIEKEVLLLCLSAVFAYLALRIRKQSVQVAR